MIDFGIMYDGKIIKNLPKVSPVSFPQGNSFETLLDVFVDKKSPKSLS